jgi:hypothetical protein
MRRLLNDIESRADAKAARKSKAGMEVAIEERVGRRGSQCLGVAAARTRNRRAQDQDPKGRGRSSGLRRTKENSNMAREAGSGDGMRLRLSGPRRSSRMSTRP